MPTIMPVSDLNNYTEVLNRVDDSHQVYLTQNGRMAYMIMRIEEGGESSQADALDLLLSDLQRAEDRANREGWIDEDEFDREMGLLD